MGRHARAHVPAKPVSAGTRVWAAGQSSRWQCLAAGAAGRTPPAAACAAHFQPVGGCAAFLATFLSSYLPCLPPCPPCLQLPERQLPQRRPARHLELARRLPRAVPAAHRWQRPHRHAAARPGQCWAGRQPQQRQHAQPGGPVSLLCAALSLLNDGSARMLVRRRRIARCSAACAAAACLLRGCQACWAAA